MILVATVLAAAAAIALSELLGRGRVIYTRLLTLMIAYLASCIVAASVMRRFDRSVTDAVAVALSTIPLMSAWMGFRIHLSNSVTLEMVTLLDRTGPQAGRDVIARYDPRVHAANRLRILRDAGYLVGEDDRVASTAKGRAVLLLIRLLCGPGGPRSVAAMLERRG